MNKPDTATAMDKTNGRRPGYQWTKLGWVPEEWEVKQLQNIVKKPIVYGIVQAGQHVPDGVPYIRSTDISGKNIEVESLQRTSLEIARKYRRSEVFPGDIIFSLRGNIGECQIVPPELPNANLTQGTARISVLTDFDAKFCSYAISSPPVIRKIFSVSKGSTFREISLADLRKVRFPLPPLPEQKNIAAILSTWDAAIQALQELIAAKEQQQKGLMQRLLTGEVRFGEFEESWKEVKLGKIFSERKEVGYEDLPLLAITAERGVIYRDQLDKKDTSSDDKSRYKRICPGDIGYNTMRMWQGRSAVSELEGIVSPAYTIVRPKVNADINFFGFLFKLPAIIDLFRRFSQGLVSDTLNCKFTNFSKVRVVIPPSVEEQSRIAGVLKRAENEISTLREKLDTLKAQKKGLMQRLLTGEVRTV
ncbi:MAG: restriction endonuclease subunit S [Lewinellaceae bacterium]|nr:restriction endonuclease subunit S [Lewinellaceae bacterium]